MKKKLITAIIALSLVLCCLVGVTVAWLIDTTDEVKNVFTVGDIEIKLTETYNTDTDNDGQLDAWIAQMIPGKTYAKNPVVSVIRPDTNVDIYLFVKFEQLNGAETYLDYISTLTTANGWTELNDGSGIWYRTVKAADSRISWNLLEGDTVTIDAEKVEKGTFDGVAEANLPKLNYKAYAIQTEGFKTAADAWAKIGN